MAKKQPTPEKSPSPAPLLNLDALEGYSVTFAGENYPLIAPDALSWKQLKRYERLVVRLHTLQTAVTLTDAEEAELVRVLDDLCRVIWQAPDAVHKRLTDIQRLAVHQAFQQLPGKMLLRLGQQARAMGLIPTSPNGRSSTRAGSSRGSFGSTGGRRVTGSTRPQSP